MSLKSKIASAQKNHANFLIKAVSALLLTVGVVTGTVFYPKTPTVHAEEAEKPAMRIQISPVENRVTLNANEKEE